MSIYNIDLHRRLTYEGTEKTVKGIEDEQFGWVVRISGLPQQCYPGTL